MAVPAANLNRHQRLAHTSTGLEWTLTPDGEAFHDLGVDENHDRMFPIRPFATSPPM